MASGKLLPIAGMAEKPLDLSNREILNTHGGLSSLDGVVDKAGQNTEVTRFQFDDKLAWTIAKNTDIFERATLVYQRALKSKAAKLGVVSGMKVTVENAAAVAAYQEAEDKLLDERQSLSGVLKISRREIQSGNKIPPGVLKNLIPILTD